MGLSFIVQWYKYRNLLSWGFVMDKVKRVRNTSAELVQRAKELRRDKTPAQRVLWNCLQNRNVGGLRFRFQHPVETFILDFYCPACKLVVEVDGSIHDDPGIAAHDAERSVYLCLHGYTVVRFRNAEIIYDTERVLAQIIATAELCNTKSSAPTDKVE